MIGIVLGVIIGVLPGLGGANGVAILLPLTFTMPPTSAIIMLSCIYWGALFGGAITSVLFNIPGEPWSVATTFDGYPMAQQGRAGEALTVTGWGVTQETPIGSRFRDRLGKAKRAAPMLMMGQIANVGWDACNRNNLYVESGMKVGKGQICALGKGRVDACQGDSGGPLVRKARGRLTVVGLVSYGMGCGLDDAPGVYVDLTHYQRWIADAKKAMKPGQIGDWPPKPAAR